MRPIFTLLVGGLICLFQIGCSDEQAGIEKPGDEQIPEFPLRPEDKNGYIPGDGSAVSTGEPVKKVIGGIVAETNERKSWGPGWEIGLAFDDDLTTEYMSYYDGSGRVSYPWMMTAVMPAGSPAIDYMLCYPRPAGKNNFGEIMTGELLISTLETGEEWISIRQIENKDLGFKRPFRMDIPREYRNQIKRFRLKVTKGTEDDVNISEIEFYQYTKELTTIPEIFADKACSRLKTGVTPAEIEALENPFFVQLAKAIYQGIYDTIRIQTCVAEPRPEVASEENGTSTYSEINGITGIHFDKGEDVIIFVGEHNSEIPLSFRIIDHNESSSGCYYGQEVKLTEGLNKFKAEKSGLGYLLYHSINPDEVMVNVASGEVNGYFDIRRHTDADWNRLISKAVWARFDLLGERVHVVFSTGDLHTYTKSPTRLLQVYDSIVFLEEQFMGLHKYQKNIYNRFYFGATPFASYMHMITYRTEYNPSTMYGLCDENLLRTEWIWGPAHEVGHVNQIRKGLRYGWTGETTNNIYSLYVQTTFGNRSNFEVYPYMKVNAFDAFFVRKLKILDEPMGNDLETKEYMWNNLFHFWQLYLYCHKVRGQEEFYMDVFEEIRNNRTDDEAKASNNFAYFASKSSGLNLIAFFGRWGYELSEATKDKIRAIPGVVEPSPAIEYIQDCNIDLYRDETKGMGGTFQIGVNGNQVLFAIEKTQNIVAYEVYADGRLEHIDIERSFSCQLPGGKKITVKAVDALGNKFLLEEK